MKKTFTIIMACIMLVSCMIAPVKAAENALQWDYILDIYRLLNFYRGTGYYSVQIDCVQDDVIEIEATATLYYINASGTLSEIDSWHYSVEDCTLSFDEEFEATSGTEYVVELDATVYTEDDSESIFFTSTKTCP